MPAIIGKKIGMTSIFGPDGKNVPCTVIEALPNIVTQIRTEEVDGYQSLQIAGGGERKEKNTPSALKGHFKKAETTPKKLVVEYKDFDNSKYALGNEISVELFEEGEYVDVVGTSKGKGFQGVVKRHGFAGVMQASHGQHNRLRAPGSIGAGSDPSRVFKGIRMAGQMGNKRTKIQNLVIVKVDKEKNLLVLSGSIPGPKNGLVIVEK